MFSVADATAADQLIYSSLSVRGALCSVSKFVPPLCSASAANNSAMWPRRARTPPLLLLFVAHAVQALTLCATACAPLRPSAPMPDTAPTLRFGVQTVKDRISPLTVSVQSRHSNRQRSPRASITALVITAPPSTRPRPCAPHGGWTMSAPPDKGLRVLSLNCRRTPEVVLSVLNSTDPAHWDVLCLQELPLHIDDYASFRSPRWNLHLPSAAGRRDSSAAIRSVIYVSNNLPSDSYTQLPLMSSDVCAVKFSFPSLSFSIFSVYNPPDSDSSISLLQSALRGPNVLGSPCILARDFNLHHPL